MLSRSPCNIRWLTPRIRVDRCSIPYYEQLLPETEGVGALLPEDQYNLVTAARGEDWPEERCIAVGVDRVDRCTG